jgi:hypothetical protein
MAQQRCSESGVQAAPHLFCGAADEEAILTRFSGSIRRAMAVAGLIGLWIALTLPANAQTAAAPQVVDSGRYQLFMGEFPFTNLDGELYWNKALFRIDTISGKVWIAESLQFIDPRDGKAVQRRRWVEFEEQIRFTPPTQPKRNGAGPTN